MLEIIDADIFQFQASCAYYDYNGAYCCGLTGTVTLNYPETTVFDIEGTYMPGKFDENVIMIQNTKELFLDFVPLSVTEKFENLDAVIFPNVGLKMVTVKTFKNARNLQYIWLTGNRISSLPGKAFINTKAFSIDLNNNVISDIAWNTFAGLSNLDSLDLHKNRIQQTLDSRLFQDLINLQYIHLSYNLITDIPADIFKNCAKLEFISFGSNRIHSLKSTMFKHLKFLKRLDVYDNEILHVERNFFDELHSLTELQFRNNICANFDLSDVKNVDLELVPILEPCFKEEVQLCLMTCTINDEL